MQVYHNKHANNNKPLTQAGPKLTCRWAGSNVVSMSCDRQDGLLLQISFDMKDISALEPRR